LAQVFGATDFLVTVTHRRVVMVDPVGVPDGVGDREAASGLSCSDGELLAEIRRRGLMPDVDATDSTTPIESTRTVACERRVSERSVIVDNLQPWVVVSGESLVPALVTGQTIQARITESGKLSSGKSYSWSIYKAGVWERIAHVSEKIGSGGTFARQSMHVMDGSGTEAFKLVRSSSSWNPGQLRFSFRVLPTNDSVPLFTVNRSVVGSVMGLMGEKWSVFRGRERDRTPVYHVSSPALEWSYEFFRADNGQQAATMSLTAGTGVNHDSVAGTWIPASFALSINADEDVALLMSVATIFDMVHDVSRPRTPM